MSGQAEGTVIATWSRPFELPVIQAARTNVYYGLLKAGWVQDPEWVADRTSRFVEEVITATDTDPHDRSRLLIEAIGLVVYLIPDSQCVVRVSLFVRMNGEIVPDTRQVEQVFGPVKKELEEKRIGSLEVRYNLVDTSVGLQEAMKEFIDSSGYTLLDKIVGFG